MKKNKNPVPLRDIFKEIFDRPSKDLLSDNILSEKEIRKLFGYNLWHLSSKNLGDRFTFTPRVPRNPFGDIDGNTTEDDFTKRISVAPDIKKALEALQESFVPGGGSSYYVYATKISALGGNNLHDPDNDECTQQLGTKKPKYGMQFSLTPYLKKQLNISSGDLEDYEKEELEDMIDQAVRGRGGVSPAQLPDPIMNKFKGCVPDEDETEELWITAPVTMDLLGILWDWDIPTIKLTRAFVSINKEKIK